MTGSRRQGKLRSTLVGAEVAMSLVLLAGAGLLLRSFAEVLNADRGFQSEDRLFFFVGLPDSYQDSAGVRARQFRSDVLSRIEAMGSVTSAAAINQRPLFGVGVGMGFSAVGQPRPEGDAVPWASWRLITPGYFETMGVPFIAGGDFTDQDQIGGERWRVIISRRIAQELWPGENAIGRIMRLWEGQEGPEAEVVGVVADMLDWGLEQGASFVVYMPINGTQWTGINFALHATADPSVLIPRLRTMLAEIDPNLPLANVQTLDEMIGTNVASRRFIMILLASFAGVALLLALAGVYGVLSYTVAQRRSEIGMRLALGASRGHVKRLIVMQGMRPVAVGLILGIAGALAASRLMSTLLFGITPVDVPTYAGVAAILAVTAALSAFLPARSAVRLDVLAALREE